MGRRYNKRPSRGHLLRAFRCVCTLSACLSGCEKCKAVGGACLKSPDRAAEFASAKPAIPEEP